MLIGRGPGPMFPGAGGPPAPLTGRCAAPGGPPGVLIGRGGPPVPGAPAGRGPVPIFPGAGPGAGAPAGRGPAFMLPGAGPGPPGPLTGRGAPAPAFEGALPGLLAPGPGGPVLTGRGGPVFCVVGPPAAAAAGGAGGAPAGRGGTLLPVPGFADALDGGLAALPGAGAFAFACPSAAPLAFSLGTGTRFSGPGVVGLLTGFLVMVLVPGPDPAPPGAAEVAWLVSVLLPRSGEEGLLTGLRLMG